MSNNGISIAKNLHINSFLPPALSFVGFMRRLFPTCRFNERFHLPLAV